ncbi:MAG: HlyD family efflux transporter periplasmic adaptor subunit [Candidatus Kapabacteria bacterium]|nr:HlyD family efflux transporter periplasmic adaptor subunit [Candidatus Kapabacteria bacterium]
MAESKQKRLDVEIHAIPSFRRTSLRLVTTAASFRTVMYMLVGILIVVSAGLIFIPWQQTVVGSGTVTSFAPEARPQTVESIISGRIVQWKVREGAVVRQGDTLCVLSDINVNFLDNDLIDRLQQLRDRTLQAQEGAIGASIQRRKQAEQRLEQSKARYDNVLVALGVARARFNRAESLLKDGLVSTREFETATANFQAAIADSISTSAAILAARQDIDAFRSEEERVISQAQVSIQEAEVRLSNATGRVGARIVTAPLGGTIVRVHKPGAGQAVKEGDQLATIVPLVDDQAVEIYVSSMDAALISPGKLVSLQFSGFPAFQFSGWQNVAIGIFHGTVRVVDAVDDGTGRFRVLIVPDTTRRMWPDARFLRQGTDVTGWVLLTEVPLGYELWRQLMGFPPQFPVSEQRSKVAAKASDLGKEKKK